MRNGGFLEDPYPADVDLGGGAAVRNEGDGLDDGEETSDETDEGIYRPLVVAELVAPKLDEAPEETDDVDEFCSCALSRTNSLYSYLLRICRSI